MIAGVGRAVPEQGQARWDALRWQSFGDGLLDALILWRNERERERPLDTLMATFALKVDAALGQLEAESTPLQESGLTIGTISVACALGYIDYRFQTLDWRTRSAGLAAWHDVFGPSLDAADRARRWLMHPPRLAPPRQARPGQGQAGSGSGCGHGKAGAAPSGKAMWWLFSVIATSV